MTAPKVIYAVPAIGGTLQDGLFMATTDAAPDRPRYFHEHTPELVKLENALQWIALGPAYDQTPQDAVLAMMKLAADALAAWEAMK